MGFWTMIKRRGCLSDAHRNGRLSLPMMKVLNPYGEWGTGTPQLPNRTPSIPCLFSFLELCWKLG